MSPLPAPGAVTLLAALASGDWSTAEDTAGGVRREASGLVAALLQWHIERGLKSLPLVDRGNPAGPTVLIDQLPARAGTGPSR